MRVNIRALIESLGTNQAGFAKKLGVNVSTVRRWTNDVVDPSPLALDKIKELQKQNEEPATPRRKPLSVAAPIENRPARVGIVTPGRRVSVS